MPIFTDMQGFFLLLFLSFSVAAQTKLELLKRTATFKHPESICMLTENTFLVSDIGKTLYSTKRDSDGVIYVCDIHAINTKNRLNKTSKLNAPKGMAIKGNTVYVADVDRVVLFNLENGSKTDEIDFGDSTLSLNDVFFLDEHTLLVSVINKHKLFALNISSKEILNLLDKDVEGANGLCKNETKMYVCGFSSKEKNKGSVYEYDLISNTMCVFQKDLGHLDGIRLYGNKLIVSDWGGDYNHGKLWEISLTSREAKVLYENPILKSPSGFDLKGNTLIVPCLDSGEILVYKLIP